MARAWPPIVFIAVSAPLPGIGMDDATPPGETSELHDLEREDPPVRR